MRLHFFFKPRQVVFVKHKFKLHLIVLVVNGGVLSAIIDSIRFNGLMGETARQVGVSISRIISSFISRSVRNFVSQRYEQLHKKVEEHFRR